MPENRWYHRLAAHCARRGRVKLLHERDNPANPYLERYFVLRTPLVSVYLHKILRSDDAVDFHDHPWAFWHVILEGTYFESRPKNIKFMEPGCWAFHRARYAHRLDLRKESLYECPLGRYSTPTRTIPVWTLVVRGPKVREWGFVNRVSGCWVHWRKYVDGERC